MKTILSQYARVIVMVKGRTQATLTKIDGYWIGNGRVNNEVLPAMDDEGMCAFSEAMYLNHDATIVKIVPEA